MRRLFPGWGGHLALACVISMVVMTGGALAQGPSPQGVWRSGESTIRVTVTRTEARGQFVEVGQGARNLGFKPAEVSFVGAIMPANLIHGEQTVRYGAKCHANGRKVPMMGRLSPNGQVLAIHFYMIQVDANCRDSGQYSVTETLWQRVAER